MEDERGGVRLQKYLAGNGVASRRRCEEIIAEGRVTVNGEVVTQMGVKVQPCDRVQVDGQDIEKEEGNAYLAFYKPPFVVTTMSDPQGRPTVAEYCKDVGVRVFPVGRLDFESEGLLLLTSDGDWANRVTHPSFNLEKEYLVKVKGNLPDGALRAMAAGIMLEGRRTWPARVEDVRHGATITQFSMAIHEGRNRQIRRMVEAVGGEVVFLKRVRVGAIALGDLAEGQHRPLTQVEIDSMRHS